MSEGAAPAGGRARLMLTPASVPRLARHARLRFDQARKRWLILVPEKMLFPSDTAVEVLKLCDGARSIEAIATALAGTYSARPAAILADVLPVLQDLADKGHVSA